MPRTDANPPMPEWSDEYQLVEVDADYLTKAVKPKQFIHIDQSECIMSAWRKSCQRSSWRAPFSFVYDAERPVGRKPMTELTQQLNAFERRLRSLERELKQLQGAAAVGAAEPVSAGREWVYFATTATPRRPDPRGLWSNLVADEVREHGLNIRRRRGSRASSTCRRSSARARSRGPAAS